MSKLEQTVTPAEDVVLSPVLERRLRVALRQYGAMKAQIKALEASVEKQKAAIGQLREQAGVASLKVDGHTVTLVHPTRSVLNKQKLVALGCAAAWIEQATEVVPSKSYEKITLAGDE